MKRAGNDPSLLDYLKQTKYILFIMASFIRLGLRRGPLLVTDIIRYPWILILIKVPFFMQRISSGRRGRYREANGMLIYLIVKRMVSILICMLGRKKNFILHQEMVPPEIFRAMGLDPWPAELLSLLLPAIDPHAAEKYIDRCENEGVPADICSHVKTTLGVALSGDMPSAPCIVSSNLPCDGSMAGYEIIRRVNDASIFRVDIPHNFYDDDAALYFAGELKKMILWLEENTVGRMDWGLLRRICEERNSLAEAETELWDMLAVRPAPLAAEPVYLSHLWAFNIDPGNSIATRHFWRLVEMARKNLSEGVSAVPDEKFRALLWNPPLLHFVDLFNWAEKEYNVSLIIDMMSYNSQSPIDTSTPDAMLRDLGRIIMQGPMARHTRGPAANYIDDIFRIYSRFNIDMIWVAGHIGCKNTMALNQMLREICRRKGIPLLIIEYDLSDPRICSKEDIIAQVDHFMENVMKVGRTGNRNTINK